MRHVFQHKPDTRQWVMGAVRIFLILIILLCSVPVSSQTMPPVTIEKVVPEKEVYPGDSIEIFLNADISKYSVDEMKVSFDRVPGFIISTDPNVLKVRVPKDLPPGDRVWVIVVTKEFRTPHYPIAVLPFPSDPWFVKFLKNPLYIGLIIYLIVVIIGFFLWRMRSRKRALQQAQLSQAQLSQTPLVEAEPKLEPLQVPDELVAACQKGECIVFVGADINKPAGLPTWQEFVQGLLQWAMDKKILDPNLGSSYSDALRKGQADLVADGVASAVQTSEGSAKDMLLKYLQDVFVRPSAQLTPAHRLLKQIGFAAALSTNLDSLLEQALDAPVFTPRDAQKLLPKLAERGRFVLKLFGTLEQPETIQISPTQFRDSVADNRMFLEFVEKLFLSRTLLFIGTSLDGVQSNLEALRLRNVPRLHYALVGVSGSEWRAKAESLQRRFNVQTLPYPVSEGETALVNFLGGLVTRLAGERRTATAAPREPPRLKRLQLENIGPFEGLDLQLDPKWNILLGDNGVGKSNILKAIALALCGKHAQHYADRLIKFGRPSGRIVLELSDGATNVTELYRTSAEPELKVLSQRELLGAERWLAIGFPPLRQLGWTLPIGPKPKPGTPYTTPGDMIPLVTGDLDPRMTDLAQVIINFDYQGLGAGGERYLKLGDEFFDVISQMTPGVTFRRGSINRQTSQIFVETDDGEVPLAAISQGTQSLMGWVGLLLERLYEVYDNMDNPREGPALVLIDEIDAHMHPRWQQTIVNNLRELFPKVQFIATTHSPLVPITCNIGEVFLVQRDRRDEGRIQVVRSDIDFRRWRADQVLTSFLFSLESSRDPSLFKAIKEYTELITRDQLSEEDTKRMVYLASQLNLQPPQPFEREEARAAFQSIKDALDEKIASIPDDKKESIKREAKAQLLESISRSRRPQ